MQVEEFQVILNEYDTLKVSIWHDFVKNKDVYFAKYININLPVYQKLSLFDRKSALGIDYCEENSCRLIYYLDKSNFIRELREALISGKRLTSQLN